MKALERAFTRHFLPVTLGSLALACGAFVTSIALGAPLEPAAKIVDATFKIAAVIVGTGWALNRYFTARTDVLQLRVDPIVELMPASETDRLLVCRLDIVNTGKSLTPCFSEVLELQAVDIVEGEVTYEAFYRWPARQAHPAGPIEPGSWSALSLAVILPSETRVVQAYLELRFETGDVWTWHRHFAAPIRELTAEHNGSAATPSQESV
jgi:hypothetical protein